jgi:hypothetical protein
MNINVFGTVQLSAGLVIWYSTAVRRFGDLVQYSTVVVLVMAGCTVYCLWNGGTGYGWLYFCGLSYILHASVIEGLYTVCVCVCICVWCVYYACMYILCVCVCVLYVCRSDCPIPPSFLR